MQVHFKQCYCFKVQQKENDVNQQLMYLGIYLYGNQINSITNPTHEMN